MAGGSQKRCIASAEAVAGSEDWGLRAAWRMSGKEDDGERSTFTLLRYRVDRESGATRGPAIRTPLPKSWAPHLAVRPRAIGKFSETASGSCSSWTSGGLISVGPPKEGPLLGGSGRDQLRVVPPTSVPTRSRITREGRLSQSFVPLESE